MRHEAHAAHTVAMPSTPPKLSCERDLRPHTRAHAHRNTQKIRGSDRKGTIRRREREEQIATLFPFSPKTEQPVYSRRCCALYEPPRYAAQARKYKSFVKRAACSDQIPLKRHLLPKRS